MSELPARDEFAHQLNTKFRVYFGAEQATEVELTQVTKLYQKFRQESFALLFTAPHDVPPFQHLYKIEHDTLGAMELFLVPVAKNEKGLHFEAVFNRLLTAADD